MTTDCASENEAIERIYLRGGAVANPDVADEADLEEPVNEPESRPHRMPTRSALLPAGARSTTEAQRNRHVRFSDDVIRHDDPVTRDLKALSRPVAHTLVTIDNATSTGMPVLQAEAIAGLVDSFAHYFAHYFATNDPGDPLQAHRETARDYVSRVVRGIFDPMFVDHAKACVDAQIHGYRATRFDRAYRRQNAGLWDRLARRFRSSARPMSDAALSDALHERLPFDYIANVSDIFTDVLGMPRKYINYAAVYALEHSDLPQIDYRKVVSVFDDTEFAAWQRARLHAENEARRGTGASAGFLAAAATVHRIGILAQQEKPDKYVRQAEIDADKVAKNQAATKGKKGPGGALDGDQLMILLGAESIHELAVLAAVPLEMGLDAARFGSHLADEVQTFVFDLGMGFSRAVNQSRASAGQGGRHARNAFASAASPIYTDTVHHYLGGSPERRRARYRSTGSQTVVDGPGIGGLAGGALGGDKENSENSENNENNGLAGHAGTSTHRNHDRSVRADVQADALAGTLSVARSAGAASADAGAGAGAPADETDATTSAEIHGVSSASRGDAMLPMSGLSSPGRETWTARASPANDSIDDLLDDIFSEQAGVADTATADRNGMVVLRSNAGVRKNAGEMRHDAGSEAVHEADEEAGSDVAGAAANYYVKEKLSLSRQQSFEETDGELALLLHEDEHFRPRHSLHSDPVARLRGERGPNGEDMGTRVPRSSRFLSSRMTLTAAVDSMPLMRAAIASAASEVLPTIGSLDRARRALMIASNDFSIGAKTGLFKGSVRAKKRASGAPAEAVPDAPVHPIAAALQKAKTDLTTAYEAVKTAVARAELDTGTAWEVGGKPDDVNWRKKNPVGPLPMLRLTVSGVSTTIAYDEPVGASWTMRVHAEWGYDPDPEPVSARPACAVTTVWRRIGAMPDAPSARTSTNSDTSRMSMLSMASSTSDEVMAQPEAGAQEAAAEVIDTTAEYSAYFAGLADAMRIYTMYPGSSSDSEPIV